MTVRTRFAPSPTGPVHIGNIRVAIYNWLFARRHGGQFLLRIEDTDRERSTPEAIQTMLEALKWLDLQPDEPPLYQSTRREAHLEAAEELLRKGLAYRADKGNTGRGEATLLKMPGRDISFDDEIKGTLRKPAESLQDLVIVRSDGAPVFHLANVLDDIAMGVTHVIRGDDHIENTYRHIVLYEALGAPPPRFAHLPMIVNERGKPYSKRDGDAYVGDFRAQGFLPDALVNYLALLGWSPGGDREVMTRNEMTGAFDLARVQSSAARMDLDKLLWLNCQTMQRLPAELYREICLQGLANASVDPEKTVDPDYADRVLELLRERIRIPADMPPMAGFFFEEEYDYDEKAVRKRLKKASARHALKELGERFCALEDWTPSSLEQALRTLADERGLGAGALIHPVRVATSGQARGPGLFEMLSVLGKERVLSRISRTLGLYPVDQGEADAE